MQAAAADAGANAHNASMISTDPGTVLSELQIPPQCTYMHEDLDLPLRLLDAFVITTKQDASRLCTPDAMAAHPIHAKGIVSGDMSTGVSHQVVLTDILDWYKLLKPAPSMQELWGTFAAHIVHCNDTAARAAAGDGPPDPQPTQPPPSKEWDAFEKAQLDALCSQSIDGPNGRKRALAVAFAPELKRTRVASRSAYEAAASSALEENEAGEAIGGWGWVPSYVDFEISPGDYRNPLKFKSSIRASDPRYAKELELRRVKMAALREEEAERVRVQRMQEAAVRAQRDAKANEARGPPPAPSDSFRLPQRLIADALAAWEVTQSFLEVLQIKPFPLSRLEAALFPAVEMPDEAESVQAGGEGAQGRATKGNSGPRTVFPVVDAPGAASAALLRDIHSQLVDAVEGKTQSLDWQRKRERGEWNPPPWAWVQRACKVLIEAPLTVVDEYTKAIAMELAYGEYNNLSVDDRVRLLAALAELAVNSELLRDVVGGRVDGEWKSRAPGVGPSLKRGGKNVRKIVISDSDPFNLAPEDVSGTTASGGGTAGGSQPGTARQSDAVRASMDEWLAWAESCRVGLRLPLGQSMQGQRFWLLGGRAGCWQVFVEGADGQQWGWYQGASLDRLKSWLRDANILEEQPLVEALDRAPALPAGQTSHEELDSCRPDAYRGLVCPLLRGEGNWPQHASASVPDQLLYCSDALLTAVDYWFKGKAWLGQHATLLEQFKAARTPQQQAQALLELEAMLHEAGWFVDGWEQHGRDAWRGSVQSCDNGQALVLRLATLQEYGRWLSSGVIPRTIFLKLEQEVRCTLWVPEPGTSVVLLRTGLLRHLDRYMLQLRILPPTAPKTPAEMDAEEAAADAVRQEEEAARKREEEAQRKKEHEARVKLREEETARKKTELQRKLEEAEQGFQIAQQHASVQMAKYSQAVQLVQAMQPHVAANGGMEGPQHIAARQAMDMHMMQLTMAQRHATQLEQAVAQFKRDLDQLANGFVLFKEDESPTNQQSRKKRGRPKDKRGEGLDPEAERVAAEAAVAKAAAEKVAKKEARDAQYALDYKAFTDSMAMYESLQQDAAHQQLSKQWMDLREEIRALNPVQRFSVASIAYRRCLNQSLMANLEDTAADPASWPVCWLLLEPTAGKGVAAEEVPPGRLAVPLHVDANLPDFMVVAETYDKRMAHTWKVDDRFRMYFAVTKTTHNKLTSTGTYFRGTVVEVDPRPAGPAAWDPWETVTIQWDPTANDPGAVDCVNPWEIDTDPEEQRRIEEHQRKREEAQMRAARAEAKSRRVDDFDRVSASDSESMATSVELSGVSEGDKKRKREEATDEEDA